MAAITASLLAVAAAPSPDRLSNLAAQTATAAQNANGPSTAAATQPTLNTGFANYLAEATQTTTATATGTTTTATATSTTSDLPVTAGDSRDTTDSTDGSAAASALAALGLFPQQLLTLPADVAAGVPAVGSNLTQSSAVANSLLATGQTPATPTDTTPSRSVELRLNTAPAAQNAAVTTALPAPVAATEPPAEVPTPPQPAPAALPAVTNTTPVASTSGEVVAAAARPPAVVPQTPVVVERTPIVPAEIGYGLVGPAVDGTPAVNPVPAVGAAPSQGQVELLAANRAAAETPPQTPAVATTPPVQPFDQVLAAEVTPPVAQPAVQQPIAPPPTDLPAVARTPGTITVDPDSPATSTPPAVERPAAGVILPQPNTPPTPSVPPPASQAAFFPTPAGPVLTPVAVEPNDRVATVESGSPQVPTPPANSAPAESPPAAPPRAAPNAPPVAAQMSEAYVTHARVVENGGTHEFQMRLDPPELGEVKVRLLAIGDRVEARLVVSDDAVKRLIESQLPDLRQRLEAAGVSVPSFDVTTDGGGRQGNTGGDGWDRSRPAFAPLPRAGGLPRTLLPRPGSAGGLIDVTA